MDTDKTVEQLLNDFKNVLRNLAFLENKSKEADEAARDAWDYSTSVKKELLETERKIAEISFELKTKLQQE